MTALFEFLGEIVGRQQLDRALFEAVDDTGWRMTRSAPRTPRCVGVLDELVERAQAAGAVRGDVGAIDVLMHVQGRV